MIAAALSSSACRTARDVGLDLGLVHGRVEDVALLAAGAAHEHGADALGVVLGDGAGALGRLVVGVGVDGQQAEGFRRHRGEDTERSEPSDGGVGLTPPALR